MELLKVSLMTHEPNNIQTFLSTCIRLWRTVFLYLILCLWPLSESLSRPDQRTCLMMQNTFGICCFCLRFRFNSTNNLKKTKEALILAGVDCKAHCKHFLFYKHVKQTSHMNDFLFTLQWIKRFQRIFHICRIPQICWFGVVFYFFYFLFVSSRWWV